MNGRTPDHDWTITPFVGVGPLTFGLLREDVRRLLRVTIRSFRKGPFATNETDAFDDLGIHAYYDENEKLELVDCWRDVAIQFNGVSFFGKSVFDVLQEPEIRKLNYLYENGMYIFETGGFSLYVEGDTIKSIGVFRRGYYD